MVPGGLELYTKLTNDNIKSGSESNISKNDVEELLLEVKVGKLEKKIADLEKEVNMQKRKLYFSHTKYKDPALYPKLYDNDAVYNDGLVAVKN